MKSSIVFRALRRSVVAAVMAVTFLSGTLPASANVLLDNGVTSHGYYIVVANFVSQWMDYSEYQTASMAFNSGHDNTLTNFSVVLQNRGDGFFGNPNATITAGIMAGNGNGAPSGVYLDQTTLSSPTLWADTTVSAADLNWAISPDTAYLLVLTGNDGANYAWLYDAAGKGYATTIGGAVSSSNSIGLVSANANANVPEPATLAVLAFGILGLGGVRAKAFRRTGSAA